MLTASVLSCSRCEPGGCIRFHAHAHEGYWQGEVHELEDEIKAAAYYVRVLDNVKRRMREEAVAFDPTVKVR